MIGGCNSEKKTAQRINLKGLLGEVKLIAKVLSQKQVSNYVLLNLNSNSRNIQIIGELGKTENCKYFKIDSSYTFDLKLINTGFSNPDEGFPTAGIMLSYDLIMKDGTIVSVERAYDVYELIGNLKVCN